MAVPETSRELDAAELQQDGSGPPRQRRESSSWLRQPQNTWTRKATFQLHLWSGLILGLYIVVVCASGSVLVFRNDIYSLFEDWMQAGIATRHSSGIRFGYAALSWFENLHGRLLLGPYGIVINAIGGFLTAAVCVTGLVIWWPGISRWRRGLIVKGGVGWKRFNFDLHSAVGFWTFAILFVWGITGGYFVFPQPFRAVIDLFTPIDPPRVAVAQSAPQQGVPRAPSQPQSATQSNASASTVQAPPAAQAPFPRRRRRPLTKGGKILQWFSFLHYGNFAGWKVKAIWTLLGFAPVILFGTALVMWWNRVLGPALRRYSRSRGGWAEAPASAARELEWEREKTSP
jgi:uncharacterized iron-regulated membrane protein